MLPNDNGKLCDQKFKRCRDQEKTDTLCKWKTNYYVQYVQLIFKKKTSFTKTMSR